MEGNQRDRKEREEKGREDRYENKLSNPQGRSSCRCASVLYP